MNNSILLKKISALLVLALLITNFAGCEVIGDIFKAGFWVGIVVVVIILILIFAIISWIRK
jgi:hypothetical protein